MGNAKVSAGFKKYEQRNARAIEEAKKAENSMQSCAMPVGWKGDCVLINAEATESKEKKDDKGNITKPSQPYVRFEFAVVGDGDYTGKKFSRIWNLGGSAKVTAEDQYEWMLNDFENIGLSKDLRKNYEDLGQVLDDFLNSNRLYGAECVVATWNKRDGKEVKVSLKQVVDSSDSTVPGDKVELKIGLEVPYQQSTWIIEDIDGEGNITIKSKTSNQKKIVGTADLKG